MTVIIIANISIEIMTFLIFELLSLTKPTIPNASNIANTMMITLNIF